MSTLEGFRLLKGMDLIHSTSRGRNILCKSGIFHVKDSPHISLSTVAFASTPIIGLITLYVEELGSHLSFQILIRSPDPTLHLNPQFSSSLDSQMHRHMQEALPGTPVSRNDVWRKYLALRTRQSKEDG